MEVPITILEAIAGGRVTVPTPTGEVKVSVPPGASSGSRLRLKGRGVQRSGKPGDLYLKLRPIIPDSDAEEVLAAAKTLTDAGPPDPRAALKL